MFGESLSVMQVKVLMQTQDMRNPAYRNSWDCCKAILHERWFLCCFVKTPRMSHHGVTSKSPEGLSDSMLPTGV